MTFKLYQDKNTLLRKNSRMVAGGTTEDDGQFLGWWDKKIFDRDITDITVYITLDLAQRPDKIAYLVYGREDYMWLVLQYNNIVDIVDELAVGKVITVPSFDRATYTLMNN